MESKIHKLPKSEVEIKVELSPAEMEKYINGALLDFQKKLEIDGFRKGKAPQEIVEKKIGKENIIVDAADSAIREILPKIILENKIEMISEPEIDILKIAPGNEFIFRAKAAVCPEINLPDYRKIAPDIKRKQVFVEEKEVGDALEWLRRSRAKIYLKNGPAEKGDFVEIEYWSQDMPELDKKQGKKDAFILGEGGFLAGFEEKLTGMNAGQEKNGVAVEIPGKKAENPEAGGKINLNVKMVSVKKAEFPEISDQFAKEAGNFKDLSDLKKSVKEGIKMEKEALESQRISNEILEKICGRSDFEIPEKPILNEQKQMLDDFKRHLGEKLNITFEEYLKRAKKNEKEVADSFLPEAKERIKRFLILKKIAEREKIGAEDREIDEEINNILKKYPDAEKAKKDIDSERLKAYTKSAIINKKVFKLLESLVS